METKAKRAGEGESRSEVAILCSLLNSPGEISVVRRRL